MVADLAPCAGGRADQQARGDVGQPGGRPGEAMTGG